VIGKRKREELNKKVLSKKNKILPIDSDALDSSHDEAWHRDNLKELEDLDKEINFLEKSLFGKDDKRIKRNSK